VIWQAWHDCPVYVKKLAWYYKLNILYIPDISYFQNTPEVTSVQHILPFSLTVSLTILCTEPLKPLVLHTPLYICNY